MISIGEVAHQLVSPLIPQLQELARTRFQEGVRVDLKPAPPQSSLVTSADLELDEVIRNYLHGIDPGIGIVSEESGSPTIDTSTCWVVDPLDGTSNFARGIPIYGIMIALMNQGVPVYGMIALPETNQVIYGGSGLNVSLNGQEVRQPAGRVGEAVVTIAPAVSKEKYLQLVELISGLNVVIRDYGCFAAQAAQTILGQTEAVISAGLASWDVMAAAAISATVPWVGIEWVSGEPGEETVIDGSYKHTLAIGKPSLVSQIAQVLRSVR